MNFTVRSKVVKIGNSRGIRIPRVLLEQAELVDEVEMAVEGNKLVIQSARQHRHCDGRPDDHHRQGLSQPGILHFRWQ